MKILLVEDKDSLRQMLSTAIRKAVYAVDEASDGDIAAEKIRKLEDEFIPKELQRDYDKTFGHNRH